MVLVRYLIVGIGLSLFFVWFERIDMKFFSSPAQWTQRPEHSEQALESHGLPCATVGGGLAGKLVAPRMKIVSGLGFER